MNVYLAKLAQAKEFSIDEHDMVHATIQEKRGTRNIDIPLDKLQALLKANKLNPDVAKKALKAIAERTKTMNRGKDRGAWVKIHDTVAAKPNVNVEKITAQELPRPKAVLLPPKPKKHTYSEGEKVFEDVLDLPKKGTVSFTYEDAQREGVEPQGANVQKGAKANYNAKAAGVQQAYQKAQQEAAAQVEAVDFWELEQNRTNHDQFLLDDPPLNFEYHANCKEIFNGLREYNKAVSLNKKLKIVESMEEQVNGLNVEGLLEFVFDDNVRLQKHEWNAVKTKLDEKKAALQEAINSLHDQEGKVQNLTQKFFEFLGQYSVKKGFTEREEAIKQFQEEINELKNSINVERGVRGLLDEEESLLNVCDVLERDLAAITVLRGLKNKAGINPLNIHEGVHVGTPSVEEPNEDGKFYCQKQHRDNNMCMINSINAFLGNNFVSDLGNTLEEMRQFSYANTYKPEVDAKRITEQQAREAVEESNRPFDEERRAGGGADPGFAAHLLKTDFNYQAKLMEGYDQGQWKGRNWNTPELKMLESQDRLIVARGGHFVAFRKKYEGNSSKWCLLDGLKAQQSEYNSLEEYFASLSRGGDRNLVKIIY